MDSDTKIIIQGDFNEIQDRYLDYSGSNVNRAPLKTPIINMLKHNFYLFIITRILNPSSPLFSHEVEMEITQSLAVDLILPLFQTI